MTPIPRSIHQTWRSAEVPPEWSAAAASWRLHHPAWEHRLWTDEDARALVASERPSLLSVYDRYPYAIQRADAFRYVVLHVAGGVYADLDLECLRPIGPLLDGRLFVLAREPEEHEHLGKRRVAGNAFLASAPGHPFLGAVLDQLESQSPDALTHLDVLCSTGPLMLDGVLERYGGDDVTVVDSETVYPLSQPGHAGELELLRRNDPEADALRRGLADRGVYAIHYWSNSWTNTLAGELRNPEPHAVPGHRFYPGWDCLGGDLENAGRDVPALARRSEDRADAVGFNTDGFLKSSAILRRRWRRRANSTGREGLYLKLGLPCFLSLPLRLAARRWA